MPPVMPPHFAGSRLTTSDYVVRLRWILTRKNPHLGGFCVSSRPTSDDELVEPGGIEPPSASPTLQDLHAYPVY